METRHLKYFVDVASTLSFTKAARMNHVVQTTMSQSISSLENQLGFKLFERNNRKVSLTQMGKLFYEDAINILNAVQLTENHISQLNRGMDGFVRIGYTGAHVMPFMPDIIREYREFNPGAGIDLIRENPGKLSHFLDTGFCDLVFTMAEEMGRANFEQVLCDSQELYLVVARNHRFADRKELSYHEIVNEPMVFFHPSCSNGMYSEMIYNSVKGGYTPVIAGYASDLQSLLLMAELGIGLTILPKTCLRGHEETLVFIKLKDSYRISIVARWLPANNNPALKPLLQIIRKKY